MKPVLLQPIEAPVPEWYDPAQPWNRQPCDTGHRWVLFREWLSDGPQRDLGPFAVRVNVNPLDVKRISAECHWYERAKAYDKAIYDAYTETVVEHVVVRAKQTAERQLSTIEAMLELADIEIKRLLAECKERTQSGTMRPRDLIRLMSEATKLKLLLTGGATERVEIADVDKVLDDLSYEQIEVLHQIQEKTCQKK